MAATVKTWANGNLPDVDDVDLNGFKNENNNLIVGSNQALDDNDNQQTHEAVSRYAWYGNVLNDTSAGANAVVLAAFNNFRIPDSADGMKVRWKNTEFANNAATTLEVGSMGVLDLYSAEDTALAGGELILDFYYEAVFDAANNRWRLAAQEQPHGFELFTADGTFNRPPGVKRYKVTCVGGGGGGAGGCCYYAGDGISGSAIASGGSGACGEVVWGYFDLASAPVVVGAGGAGGAGSTAGDGTGATDGGAGGDSTFNGDADLHANGGFGGFAANLSGGVVNVPAGSSSADYPEGGIRNISTPGTEVSGALATPLGRHGVVLGGLTFNSINQYQTRVNLGWLGAGAARNGGGGDGGRGRFDGPVDNSGDGTDGEGGYVLVEW